MNDKRLSEAEIDRLTSDLHKKLKRQRLRPGLWLFAALCLVAALVYGVWHALKMPAGLPPVMLVCYDALAIDPAAKEEAAVEAQLIAPGHPNAKLDDQEIFFELDRNGRIERSMAKTAGNDAVARLTLGNVVAGETISARAWFIDPQGTTRRDDRARIDVVGKGATQLVMIAQVAAADEPIDWLSEKAASLPVNPAAAKLAAGELPTVYCCGDVSPNVYRGMRSWLRSKFDQNAGLPPGVLLRMTHDALIQKFEKRGVRVKMPLEKL